MPVMDGAELATAMRESEAYRDIPIVMMTSLPSGHAASECAVPHSAQKAVYAGLADGGEQTCFPGDTGSNGDHRN